VIARVRRRRGAAAPPAPTAAEAALTRADALVAEGRALEAIRLLAAAERARRDPAVEARLVDLRHRAFADLPTVPADAVPPRVQRDPGPVGPLPELTPADLTVETLRQGLSRHGCVLIRGLVSPERAAHLAAGIDAALDAFDATGRDPDAAAEGWYRHFTPTEGDYRVGGRRGWVRATGAVWTADSPRMLAELTELVDDTGILALVTEYLGERPALSANKCTLRRVPTTSDGGWHQDGAFLGEEVRSLNLWLGLTRCGRDAPGLDLVPRRFDHVVETGGPGAYFDWAVSDQLVEQLAADTPVLRPELEAGDALLFDHLFLHRTAVAPEMTSERHAMETWFFAPSAYPEGQIPLAL
jgi:hypothetical protein